MRVLSFGEESDPWRAAAPTSTQPRPRPRRSGGPDLDAAPAPARRGAKSFLLAEIWLTVPGVESHYSLRATEFVPVETLRSGDPITDVHGGGQHYRVLESKPVGDSCVVLELECKANDVLRVIEKSYPAGYEMGLSPRQTFL